MNIMMTCVMLRSVTMNKKITMTANQLFHARLALDLSQQELADRLGVARNTVTRWELDVHRVPSTVAQLVQRWLDERVEHLPQSSPIPVYNRNT